MRSAFLLNSSFDMLAQFRRMRLSNGDCYICADESRYNKNRFLFHTIKKLLDEHGI